MVQKSYVLVYNTATAGQETKLAYYMAMDDTLDNGFPLTIESGLDRKIVFARNSTQANAIPSISAATSTQITLAGSTKCIVTKYY